MIMDRWSKLRGLSKLMVCDRKSVQRRVQVLASFELGVTRTLVKAAAAFRLTAVGIGRTCYIEMTCLVWKLPRCLKWLVQEESSV